MKHIPVTTESVKTRQRSQMIDVTDCVERAIEKAGITDGIVVVFVEHTTAAVTIQENADPDVQHDLLTKLEKLVPQLETYYQHDEGNSDSHLKTAMLGNSVTVIIENGKMILGQWQGIYFVEFDGPRERRMLVKVIHTGN